MFQLIKRLFIVCVMVMALLPPSVQVSAVQDESVEIGNPGEDFAEPANNCFVLLEPVLPNKTDSYVLEFECGLTNSELQSKFATTSAYLIAQFYDNKDYDTLIVNFGGTQKCSSTASYQVPSLPSSINNKISSGAGFSGCNNIYVYDFTNYGGVRAYCQYGCGSFGVLNDRVSSWKVTN